MKKRKLCWACIKQALASIHIVDKCLIIFMFLLLLQSSYNLLSGGQSSAEIDSIDVIIRTSTAAIFGYFLSGNFISRASPYEGASSTVVGSHTSVKSPAAPPDNTPINQIGFITDGEAQEHRQGHLSSAGAPKSAVYTQCQIQAIVATAIGVFCLFSLLLMRFKLMHNTAPAESASITSTIAQFRDLVSGCVGFLIGSPSTIKAQT